MEFRKNLGHTNASLRPAFRNLSWSADRGWGPQDPPSLKKKPSAFTPTAALLHATLRVKGDSELEASFYPLS